MTSGSTPRGRARPAAGGETRGLLLIVGTVSFIIYMLVGGLFQRPEWLRGRSTPGDSMSVSSGAAPAARDHAVRREVALHAEALDFHRFGIADSQPGQRVRLRERLGGRPGAQPGGRHRQARCPAGPAEGGWPGEGGPGGLRRPGRPLRGQRHRGALRRHARQAARQGRHRRPGADVRLRLRRQDAAGRGEARLREPARGGEGLAGGHLQELQRLPAQRRRHQWDAVVPAQPDAGRQGHPRRRRLE